MDDSRVLAMCVVAVIAILAAAILVEDWIESRACACDPCVPAVRVEYVIATPTAGPTLPATGGGGGR